MKSDMGIESGVNDNDAALGMHLSDNTQRLNSAISSLPALLEKKRLIDMHTSLATAMLDQIKLRKLDVFFELEEKILSRQALDRSLMQVTIICITICFYTTSVKDTRQPHHIMDNVFCVFFSSFPPFS